jgi:hypothetical protein
MRSEMLERYCMYTEFSFAVLICYLAVNVVFHKVSRLYLACRKRKSKRYARHSRHTSRTTVNRESESERKKKRQRSQSSHASSYNTQIHSSQPQRIAPRLRVAPNPLATRHVLFVLLHGLPLVLLFDHILHVLCCFAGWLSDLGGDVAHGGPEDCFQAAAYRVADGVEEAFWGVSLLIC